MLISSESRFPTATVKRTDFADRPDMVLVDLHNGAFALFNPRTFAIDLVWRGTVDWRGKVFNFSQETSQAHPREGSDDFLINRIASKSLVDSPTLDSSHKVAIVEGIDLQGTSDAWLDLADEWTGSSLGWFESATHVTSEMDWQWNRPPSQRTDGLPAEIAR